MAIYIFKYISIYKVASRKKKKDCVFITSFDRSILLWNQSNNNYYGKRQSCFRIRVPPSENLFAAIHMDAMDGI